MTNLQARAGDGDWHLGWRELVIMMTGQRVLWNVTGFRGVGEGARGERARIREATYTSLPGDDYAHGKGEPVLEKHRCKHYVILKLFLRLWSWKPQETPSPASASSVCFSSS